MRSQIASAFLVALVLAATPASSSPLGSDAQLVCGNQSPSGGAAAASNPQITPDDPNVGTAACPSLCKKWLGTCKGAVAAVKGCWLRAIGKVGAVRKATCRTLDGAAKDTCLAIVSSERDAAKDFVKSDSDTGRNFCEGTGFANCILNCS